MRVFSYISENWEQLGTDLLGEREGDRFGLSIDLSGDGEILAVGAPYNDDAGQATGNNLNNTGSVRVYRYQSGSWIQIGSDIDAVVGYSGSGFGTQVALSDDGKRLVVTSYTKLMVYDLDASDTWVRVFDFISLDGSDSGTAICGGTGDNALAVDKYANKVVVGLPGAYECGDESSRNGIVQVFSLED